MKNNPISLMSIMFIAFIWSCTPSNEKVAALFTAVKKGDTVQVDNLLSGGLKVDEIDDSYFGNKQTPLMKAAFEGNIGMINFLLRKGANINALSSTNEQPIHYAMRGNNPQAVELLLKKGADVHWKDEHSVTLVMKAAKDGQLEIIQSLVNHGAKVEAEDFNDETAFFYAATGDLTHSGLFKGDARKQLLEFLIKKGADKNHKNEDGATALIKLCKEKKLSASSITTLINLGVDVNIKDKYNYSALHYVTQQKMTVEGAEVYAKLLVAGAK